MSLGKRNSVKTLTGYLRYASHPRVTYSRKIHVFDEKACGFGLVWWKTEPALASQADLALRFTLCRLTGFHLIGLGLAARLFAQTCC
jgi:hypothetical protein